MIQNAHKLWQALMLTSAELGLRHKEQIGVLSFAELTDIFYYKTGEIHLHHDADPGDITISASASNLLDEFVGELIKLDRYKINY
ncbi:MAG: hypothetical protein R2941_09140 [Desulfobacterales bacterium]